MKKIWLTFDDGLKSHYEIVKPALTKNNLKGTFFVTRNQSLWVSHNLMFQKKMDESAFDFKHLKEFEESGLEIGNHTFSHLNLTTLSDENIKKEICMTTELLLNYGVKNIDTFCYPGYYTDERVANIVESLGFKKARTGYSYLDEGWSKWEIDEKPLESRPKIKYPDDSKSDFLIKPKGILNHVYRFNEFFEDVNSMNENESAVFVFHGVKEEKLKNDFFKIVDFLSNISSIKTINFSEIQ